MTRLALLLAAMGALVLLGRSVQGRTASAPAPIDDVDWLREFMVGERGPELVVPPRGAYITAAEWRN